MQCNVLMDHTDNPFFLVPFHAKEDAETLGGIVRGDPGEYESMSTRRYGLGFGLIVGIRMVSGVA